MCRGDGWPIAAQDCSVAMEVIMSTAVNVQALPAPTLPTRRDFLTISATAFAGIGAAAALWPLADSLNPSIDSKAHATTEVDISHIQPGQSITILWRGKPVFVVHRTQAQIAEAEAGDAASTIDPARDRTRVQRPEWLVVVGVCTHLGCTPTTRARGDLAPRFGGWVCPCHFSQYDISGRVRRGPAPTNLAVPPYRFDSDARLVIG
jgi:ubiquinol-cytochrome c reductase iron-sulfur subunit